MNLPVLLLLEGLCFVVLFGVLSLTRREGLSGQFAVEAVVITMLFSGLTALSGYPTHPIFLLIVLYLLTMRVRLLVDVGNFFAQRGMFDRAERCYDLARRLWPDQTGRAIIQLNHGTARLQQGALDEAIQSFKDILQNASQGHLGIKHEAAAHYNLGVAYRRKRQEAQAVGEFNAVLDTWPVSEYAHYARAALTKSPHKSKSPVAEKDTPPEQ